MDSGESAFLASAVLFVVGALGSLALRRRVAACNGAAHGAALLGAAAALVAALRVLVGGEALSVTLGQTFPFGPWAFRVDALGAFFLLAFALPALAASGYALGYVREFYGRDGFFALGAAYNLFLLSLLLVLGAGNAFTFLVVWELMALTSFLLVVFRHREAGVTRAGFVYIVMTHAGTACITGAFLLLFRATGSLDFSAWAAAAAGGTLPAGVRTAAFLLALAGFGAKAGVIPLHVWLPLAHPAAPSHVSALMSGVMLKVAVYGFLRFLPALGPAEPWWGAAVLAAGAVTALLGILYALVEVDLKRFLAFSSVENVGVILLGLGAALSLQGLGLPTAAALALAASLYHVLNHAVFKGLLFLGAGAVIGATHTGNMDRLGGLARRMPVTSLLFLVGALSISALPPFNGFVSEWLTLQSLLALGLSAPSAVLEILAPVGAAALALTGALAAAGFVRAYGMTFLALPRSEAAAHAAETSRSQRAAMVLPAVLCLALGLAPGWVLRLLTPAVAAWTGAAPVAASGWGAAASVGALAGRITPGLLFALLAVPGIAVLFLLRAAARRRPERLAPTWGCGIALTPRMEYSASAFSQPLRMIFRQILRPRPELEARHEVSPYFACYLRYRTEITPVFERYLYGPAARLLVEASHRLRGIQAGGIRLYLAYILATLVFLLVVAL